MKSYGTSVEIELLPYPTINSLFSAIKSGKVDRSVIPISNSTNGSVSQTLELIAAESSKENLNVCGETSVNVRQHLVGRRSEQALSDSPLGLNHDRKDQIKDRQSFSHITSIHTHPQAWTQCSPFLTKTFDATVARVDEDSTSAAAELVARDKTGRSAAICSQLAAKLFELDILANDIQEATNNQTRFLVLKQISERNVQHSQDGLPLTSEFQKESLFVCRLPLDMSISQFTTLIQQPDPVPMKYFTWEDSNGKGTWAYLFLTGSNERQIIYAAQLKKQLSSINSEWRCWGEWTVGDYDETVME